ncbi:response regulator [Vallitalea pronyensis]|uniref:Stage 0 sporulation protein A homolog n=1 Tax=Vallitalea pronyensis TaxID=1348613 RepID=A0A8J8SGN2_9FIRM|nr:response regulator [Vallitalea pronyensis]QUI22781.1 response regulator [Vallitalea pronyensis]
MYKLLIVDDERIIRTGLANLVPWSQYNIEIIEAFNGLNGLDMIRQHHPEFVMTDLKMPGMGGLRLIEEAIKIDPSIIFVILSGYNEFEFAQKAMSYGVKHYLLKPADEIEVLDIIKKIMSEQKESMETRNILEKLKNEAPALFEQSHSSNQTVNLLVNIIKENLEQEYLSLNWIAEHVLFMNADYLGKLFKQQMQITFSQYCLQERMSRAKALLLTTHNLKISVIAKKVGYGNNPQYFSQVFKKYVGYTPNAYRKNKKSC